MKIAIDASQIVYGTGVSVYTKNLIQSLLQIDQNNDYLLLGGSIRRIKELRKEIRKLINDRKNAKELLLPISPTLADFIFNRMSFMNIDTIIGKYDVFHSSDWVQPATNAYKVTTIHDLVPILYPKLIHPRIVSVHRRRLARVQKYADKIIVPSNTTKEDLINYGFNQEKIVTIPEAVDTDLKKPTIKEILKTKKRYRIIGNYLLAIGTGPRKNLERVISAFEKVRTGYSVKLVVVGEAKKILPVRNVVFLGHIPRADMAKIYCGSQALIYTSLYEGFGLPVIEAYALGVPVLTSNIGSMKEVGSDGALLVDPYDVDMIKDGITKLLLKRQFYIKKGKKR